MAALTSAPCAEERPDDVRVSGPGRGHRGDETADLRGVDVGSGGDQGLDHGEARVLARAAKRADAVVLGRIHVGAPQCPHHRV